MARTSKSRGVSAFQMRSGNSPHKFLGKINKAISNVAGKVFGGGGGGAEAAPVDSYGRPNRGMENPANPINKLRGVGGFGGGMMGGNMLGGPGSGMLKKEQGYTPYKKVGFSCSSPLKGADAILVRGAYDAESGKGTAKYGQIAKSRAFTSIAKTTGKTFGHLAAQHKIKKEAERRASLSYKKTQWKKDAKFEKWKERKGKGWKDNIRYA
tara:strand:- start:282 stop:911 length:630 start_codon:yes stop_codon:yes gene_type:complete